MRTFLLQTGEEDEKDPMISQHLLSTQPQLKNHVFVSSEDHPKEFILVNQENGAALGISHTEKRLAEFMNGQDTLAQIIQKVIQEQLATLSQLRQFLWDLHRYGFLEKSPWDSRPNLEGWGYWGKTGDWGTSFWLVSVLGPLEPILGRLLSSIAFHAASFLLFAGILFQERSLFQAIDPFLIRGSFAFGLLVVILSVLGGILLAFWFGAMVLRTLHPSPVRCLADYRYALPVFRLDGRRLRALPTRQALRIALSPVIGLLFLSSLTLLWAGASTGVRQEGLYHITIALWLSILLLEAPWNSTLLSRDVMLRLRGQSVWGIMILSARRVFYLVFQPRLENEPHEKLSIAWGLWTVVGSLLVLRIAALAIRWKMPVLVSHLLQEENRLILFLLFGIFGISAAAAAATALSFFAGLGREIIREIHHRYWPERDFTMAALGGACLVFVLTQYFWSIPINSPSALKIPIAVCGLFLTVSSLFLWKHEGVGYETLILLFPLANGIFLLMQSIGGYCLPSPMYGFSEVEEAFPAQNDFSAGHPFCAFYSFAVLGTWLLYWISLYVFLLKPAHSLRKNRTLRIAASLTSLVMIVLILKGLPSSLFFWDKAGKFLLCLLLPCMVGGVIWFGSLRNHSSFLLCAGSVMMYIASLNYDSILISNTGPLTLCLGAAISLCALFLRASALAKIVSCPVTGDGHPSIKQKWTRVQIETECRNAFTSLYNAVPRLLPSPERSDQTLRDYFEHLHDIAGTQGLDAITRRIMRNAPWHATQQLFQLLPAPVPVANLTDWNNTRVEEWLCRVPTFASIHEETETLAQRTRVLVFNPGERLIHQGKQEDALYFILEGNVVVEIERPFGNRIVTILGPHDFVGEIAFLTGTQRTATVRALSPTLVLCLHREDIDEDTPKMLAVIRESETGDSWLQAFCSTLVFSEFPASLSTRICLESRKVQLYREESLWLETPDLSGKVAVFLQGKGSMIENGNIEPLTAGSIIGLQACLSGLRMRGTIRAQEPSRILLVDRDLLREALGELLMPASILEKTEEDGESDNSPPEGSE